MDKSHPSTTAYLVANGVCRTHAKPEYKDFVSDKSARLFSAFILQWSRDSENWIKAHALELAAIVEPVTLGIEEHYVMRKRLIEEQVRLAIKNGARQIVNVSAGFDTLCTRLCEEFHLVRFFEIDHPATQRTKLKALEFLAYRLPDNLYFYDQDWTVSDFTDFIDQSCFSSDVPSVFIMEGLSMYLTRGELEKLLTDIHVSCKSGSTLIIGIFGSLMHARKTSSGNKLQNVYDGLASISEKYKFSMSYELSPDFLKRNGFAVKFSRRMGDLQRDFKPNDECDQISSQINAENYFIAESIQAM